MELKFEVRLTGAFSDWLDSLADEIAIEAIVRRIARVQLGNFGDHKPVGDGVSELRIQHGPGYRVYYTIRGRVIVFMLGGGTKRTQARDIERAKREAEDI